MVHVHQLIENWLKKKKNQLKKYIIIINKFFPSKLMFQPPIQGLEAVDISKICIKEVKYLNDWSYIVYTQLDEPAQELTQ